MEEYSSYRASLRKAMRAGPQTHISDNLEWDAASVANDLIGDMLGGLGTDYEIVDQRQYEIIETEKGDGLVRLIEEAKESILVTHFSAEEYSLRYREVQKQKILEGLEFVRIITYDLNREDSYLWLNSLRNLQHYKEYECRGDDPLDFDIMIIDMRKVLLLFRSDPDVPVMDKAFLFDDPNLARMIKRFWSLFLPVEGKRRKRFNFLVKEI